MPVCPVCGKVFAGLQGFARHVRVCRKRPPRGTLERLHRAGTTVDELVVRYGVSEHSIRAWMREEGYRACDRDRGNGRVLRTCPELAPMLGQARGCEYCPPEVRERCERLVMEVGWILCEAPDEKQILCDVWG